MADPEGVEALPGESEAEYVARQARLRAEAAARMRAKFGASAGLQGKMGGVGAPQGAGSAGRSSWGLFGSVLGSVTEFAKESAGGLALLASDVGGAAATVGGAATGLGRQLAKESVEGLAALAQDTATVARPLSSARSSRAIYNQPPSETEAFFSAVNSPPQVSKTSLSAASAPSCPHLGGAPASRPLSRASSSPSASCSFSASNVPASQSASQINIVKRGDEHAVGWEDTDGWGDDGDWSDGDGWGDDSPALPTASAPSIRSAASPASSTPRPVAVASTTQTFTPQVSASAGQPPITTASSITPPKSPNSTDSELPSPATSPLPALISPSAGPLPIATSTLSDTISSNHLLPSTTSLSPSTSTSPPPPASDSPDPDPPPSASPMQSTSLMPSDTALITSSPSPISTSTPSLPTPSSTASSPSSPSPPSAPPKPAPLQSPSPSSDRDRRVTPSVDPPPTLQAIPLVAPSAMPAAMSLAPSTTIGTQSSTEVASLANAQLQTPPSSSSWAFREGGMQALHGLTSAGKRWGKAFATESVEGLAAFAQDTAYFTTTVAGRTAERTREVMRATEIAENVGLLASDAVKLGRAVGTMVVDDIVGGADKVTGDKASVVFQSASEATREFATGARDLVGGFAGAAAHGITENARGALNEGADIFITGVKDNVTMLETVSRSTIGGFRGTWGKDSREEMGLEAEEASGEPQLPSPPLRSFEEWWDLLGGGSSMQQLEGVKDACAVRLTIKLGRLSSERRADLHQSLKEIDACLDDESDVTECTRVVDHEGEWPPEDVLAVYLENAMDKVRLCRGALYILEVVSRHFACSPSMIGDTLALSHLYPKGSSSLIAACTSKAREETLCCVDRITQVHLNLLIARDATNRVSAVERERPSTDLEANEDPLCERSCHDQMPLEKLLAAFGARCRQLADETKEKSRHQTDEPSDEDRLHALNWPFTSQRERGLWQARCLQQMRATFERCIDQVCQACLDGARQMQQPAFAQISATSFRQPFKDLSSAVYLDCGAAVALVQEAIQYCAPILRYTAVADVEM